MRAYFEAELKKLKILGKPFLQSSKANCSNCMIGNNPAEDWHPICSHLSSFLDTDKCDHYSPVKKGRTLEREGDGYEDTVIDLMWTAFKDGVKFGQKAGEEWYNHDECMAYNDCLYCRMKEKCHGF